MAIAPRKAAQAALLAWVPMSSRLASARLKGATVNLTVVAVHAPKLDADQEVKDSFSDDLQEAFDRVPAGDWNARPGPVHPATRHILGKFAVGMRFANGDRLVTFASLNRLVVSSTRFQHPQRHLVLQRLTRQEPNQPHASAVPLGLLRGKQRGHYAGTATLTGRRLRKRPRGRRYAGIPGNSIRC